MEDTSANFKEHEFETISKNQSVWYIKNLTSEEFKINEMMKKMGYEVEPGCFIDSSSKITSGVVVKIYCGNSSVDRTRACQA